MSAGKCKNIYTVPTKSHYWRVFIIVSGTCIIRNNQDKHYTTRMNVTIHVKPYTLRMDNDFFFLKNTPKEAYRILDSISWEEFFPEGSLGKDYRKNVPGYTLLNDPEPKYISLIIQVLRNGWFFVFIHYNTLMVGTQFCDKLRFLKIKFPIKIQLR